MYNNNPSLRAAGESIEYTPEMIQEWLKCKEDILYFCETYCYIVSIDEGRQIVKLREYQKRMLKSFITKDPKRRHRCVLSGRQSGKTAMMVLYMLHYILFNSEKTVAILANNERTATDILRKLKEAYEQLPLWLQQGVSEGGWSKTTIKLENGCHVISGSTSSNGIRGRAISLLLLDEFAFVPNNIADEFIASVYPTIASGITSQIIMVSTPKGINHFYNFWQKAVKGENNFIPVKINWWEVPGRDEEWKDNTIRDIGLVRFNQEYSCLESSTELEVIYNDSDIHKVSIEFLFNLLINETPLFKGIAYNTDYKILTPNGYCDFTGITNNGRKLIFKLILENGMAIEASEDHIFYTDNQPRKLKNISIGSLIETTNGFYKVISIENTNKSSETFDVININNEKHTFYANGIETSNCSFLGSSQTLIDPYMLEKLGPKTRDPSVLKYNGALKIFEEPIPESIYVLGVDTAAGSGGDYSVIQVIKFNSSHNIEQVAVYSSNTVSYAKFTEVVIAISQYYNDCNIMIENNDIGGQVANLIWHDYEYDKIINTDKKGIGTRSTKKSKLVANMLLKRFVENEWLHIYDEETFRQITLYEEINPNVFKASGSEHDDCVTSMLWALYYTTTQYFEFIDWDTKKINPNLKKELEYKDAGVVVFNDDHSVDEFGFDESNWS